MVAARLEQVIDAETSARHIADAHEVAGIRDGVQGLRVAYAALFAESKALKACWEREEWEQERLPVSATLQMFTIIRLCLAAGRTDCHPWFECRI